MNSFNTIMKHFGERRHGEVCRDLPTKPILHQVKSGPRSLTGPIANYEFICPRLYASSRSDFVRDVHCGHRCANPALPSGTRLRQE